MHKGHILRIKDVFRAIEKRFLQTLVEALDLLDRRYYDQRLGEVIVGPVQDEISEVGQLLGIIPAKGKGRFEPGLEDHTALEEVAVGRGVRNVVDADVQPVRAVRCRREQQAGDAEIITQLFQVALSRKPTDAEIKNLLAIVAEYGDDRATALQDVAWSILTSTEFTFNH